jgi:predicted phage terminase large subunit-like protein
MGLYLFANQYQNETIPDAAKSFKNEWIKYYHVLPENLFTYIFIDPAISQQQNADFTGIAVVSTDPDGIWYIRRAKRYKLTPTEVINLIFDLYDEFKPMCIGIEDVAFQKALLYFSSEEMTRRAKYLPIVGIKPSTERTKETRILGLVPRFEFGRVFIGPECSDLLQELKSFPRGAHDDVIDALAYIEQIAGKPQNVRDLDEEPAANHPSYESWYIRQLSKRRSEDS